MDSDGEREEETTWKGIPATIVLINVFDHRKSNMASVAHAAACRMIKQYLRTSNSYMVGVCLYGTEESSSSSILDTKNILEVIPLRAPTLDDFKKLRSLEMSTIKPVKDLELSGVLWHCSKMFASCKKLLSSHTVVLLTRLDTPPIQTDQKPAFKRVVDLVDCNVDVKVINISQDEYKVDPFYENFLVEANKGKDYVLPKPVWDPSEIEKLMHQLSHRHLAVAHLSFEIGEGLAIGVGVYNLLNKTGYVHKKVNLDRETNAIVTSVNKTVKVSNEQDSPTPGTSAMAMDVDEAEPKHLPLLKSELLYYVEYGGERIEFSDNEKKKLQNPFGNPTMKLLGFKPASLMCKEKWYLKTGAFLFPNENIIEGSTVAFKALHQACCELSSVAICILITRVNSKPNIVALSPCTHPLGLNVEMGFDIINIPFEENVRDLSSLIEADDETTVTQEQKNLMKTILKTIKFDYKPDMFENPKTECKFRAIEAIALEEDPETFVDTTKPSSSNFEILPADEFEQLFGPFAPVATKRAPTSKESVPSKKPKVDLDLDLVKSRVQSETVHMFTVNQLKDCLKLKYDPAMPALTGLKKNQLVDLVYNYYSEDN